MEDKKDKSGMSKRLKLNKLQKLRCGKVAVTTNCEDNETSKFFYINQKHDYNVDNDHAQDVSNINTDVAIELDKQFKYTNDRNVADAESDKSKKQSIENDKVLSWFPDNWEEQYNNIKCMRQQFQAPVDEMGCHKCADGSVDSSLFRFQTLIALMLSSQTKDQVTYEAMTRLKEADCTPTVIASLSDEVLGQLIYPVSFWKRKIGYLKNTSKILIDQYNGDIPNNVKELCNLPGVGPKMAHICMQVAWNEISGIGVDTHVHRISNRLKWVREPTKTPEKTREQLESWLPKKLWSEVNHLFVGFGQEICQSRNPKCSECLNKSICPYATLKYQF